MAAVEQQPVVVLVVYKYLLQYQFVETYLIPLQLAEEELRVLMEILVVQEIIQ